MSEEKISKLLELSGGFLKTMGKENTPTAIICGVPEVGGMQFLMMSNVHSEDMEDETNHVSSVFKALGRVTSDAKLIALINSNDNLVEIFNSLMENRKLH